jgi:hypothetical protein
LLVYLAGSFGRRVQLRGYRAALEIRGHQVTSRWLAADRGNTDQLEHDALVQLLARQARENLEDIERAQAFILFTENGHTPRSAPRGTRHVEFGYALGILRARRTLNYRVLVVWRAENMFHYAPEIEVFPTFTDALATFP